MCLSQILHQCICLTHILATNSSVCAPTSHSAADIPAWHLGCFLFGTHQGDIEEVFILLDLGEGSGDVGVEVIPSQAKLLRGHC